MLHAQESSMQDRLHFMFLNFVGQVVSVHTVDGAIVEGLFVGAADKELTIILSRARNKVSSIHTHDDPCNCKDTLLIHQDQIIYLDCIKAQFRFGDVKGVNEGLRHMGMDFPMQRWSELEETEAKIPVGETLEDGEEAPVATSKPQPQPKAGRGDPSKPWDQFAENKKLFNVKSTYKEEYYTTSYNPNEFTREQHEAASRMARQIETSTTNNVQHRVERGEDFDGDEGALWSDVNQAHGIPGKGGSGGPPLKTGGPGAYVPPVKKGDDTHQQPAAPTSVGGDAIEDRVAHMQTTQPTQRQTKPGQPEHGKSVAAPQPLGQLKGGAGLNAAAAAWKPGGATGSMPSSPVTERVIDNMLETMAVALVDKMKIKSCPPDWPGDDLYYDENEESVPGGQRGYGQQGGFAPQGGYQQPSYSPQMGAVPPQFNPPQHHGGHQQHMGMHPAHQPGYGGGQQQQQQQQHGGFPGHQQQFHQSHHGGGPQQHGGGPGGFVPQQMQQQQHHQVHQPHPQQGGFPQRGGMDPNMGQMGMGKPQHVDPSGFGGRGGGGGGGGPGPQGQFQQSHALPSRGGRGIQQQSQPPPQAQPQQPIPTQGPSAALPPMPVDQSSSAQGADPRRQLRGRGGGTAGRQEEPSRPGPPGSSVETGKKKK